jgi:hypothetical protein
VLSGKIANHLGHALIGLVAANLARDASPQKRLMWGVVALTAHYLLDTVVSEAFNWTSARVRRPAHESAA